MPWSGSIPSALGELDNLKVLDLRNNVLTGPIPATLGQLSSLEVLDLSDNELTGPIPRDLGALSTLWWLDLRDNALAGPIPSELGVLSELVWLDLAGNGLSGPIPSELGALERLTKLSLWRNDLTGSIPGRLGTLPNLEQLYLGENKLTGPIPAELGGLTNLRQLYLAGNALTGPIPAALGDLTNLEVLHLRNNELTGEIPPEIENLTRLQVFNIRNTGLCVMPGSELHTWLATITFHGAVCATNGGPVAAQTKDDFEYWDLNGNSDLTCTEASGKDEGLKLPAYRDNRDGTGLIYEWLQRQRSSDTDNDGIACDSTSNPNGYVPRAGSTTPPPTNARECPAGSPTWMDLPVCEEGARVSYDRDAFGSAYSSLEDEIIDALPKSDGQVYTPYTCTLFDIQADGTAATDIEHIVALAEAYDSGLAESQFRIFAGDIDNLTIADPTVNRRQKSDLDAGEWEPPENRGWFAARVVAVKQEYGLSVNPAERDALQAMLNSDPSRTVSCGDGLTSGGPTYYFPHLAVGASWQTTITYINYSPEEVTCQTDFLSDQGTPLLVSFAGLGTVDSRTDVLPPEGSVHQETNVDLSAPLAPGWARATCSGPVKASLLFRRRNSEGVPTAEAGVNAAAVPATRFVTFAEQGEGQFGTGVAYANPSATAAHVTFSAKDAAGHILASVDRELLPGGHDAHGMASLFGLTSFTGSIEVTSTEPIVTLSLNFEADPVFSSLPPGEPDAAAQGSTTYYFPHLAVGASWQTTITYINYSPEEVTCQTDFLSDYGSPLMVSFAGLGMVVSRTDVLPPGGSVHQETNVDLSASLAPGWARATCSGPVKASLLFRRHNSEGVPTAEAAVNAAAVPATRFVTFAEQGEGQFGTGVAYANPSATAAHVTFTARDTTGHILASVDRTQLSGGHDAHGMGSLFGLTSFTGSLEVTSTVPIVSLSLNFEADPVFSSLPPGIMLAPADEAAFNDLFVGKRAATNFPGAYVDFVSPGRFSETRVVVTRTGSYTYRNTGSNTGMLTFNYDDGDLCTAHLTFASATMGTATSMCNDGVNVEYNWQLVEIPSG